jgi:hypothetical protein
VGVRRQGVDTSGWGVGSAKAIEDLLTEVNGDGPHSALPPSPSHCPVPTDRVALCALQVSEKAAVVQLIGERCFRVLSIVKVVVRQQPQSERRETERASVANWRAAVHALKRGGGDAENHKTAPTSHLVNCSQRMADGRVRPRNTIPTIKLLSNESPADGARRGLRRELGELSRAHTPPRYPWPSVPTDAGDLSPVPTDGAALPCTAGELAPPEAITLLPATLLQWNEFNDSTSFPGLPTQVWRVLTMLDYA